MPQPLIITLLLFVFVLPILGAVVLRLLLPRLSQAQLGGAAAALLAVVIASVLVLARSDIPSLQIGNLSILLPVTAADNSTPQPAPAPPAEQLPPDMATNAPLTATAVLSATALPTATAVLTPTALPSPTTVVSPTATQTATAEPTAEPTATATPEPTAVPPTAVPPTAAPAPPAQRTYTVQPGDTLLSIARQFNTTVSAIVKANNLTPEQADSLHVGQKLVIP
jgi:LysM repeat protein